jgi:NAD-dependent dihydropyrimidine dehydrogenase PreA subunit
MVKRKIISIDEEKCNGCGLCIPNCPEGALQVIDGKVRLISDIFCDGLGACIGHCPQDAITTEERDAQPYDEKKVMKNIIKAGKNTIIAHLNHLKEHGETGYLKEALEVLKEKGMDIDFNKKIETPPQPCSCPSAKMVDFSKEKTKESSELGERVSHLKQWPIQLHLVPTNAPYFQKKDVLLVADCVGYSIADFHKDYLKGRSIAIACPKLDSNTDIYIDKLTELIDEAEINSLTVMTMQVPCCSGLLLFAKKAAEKAKRKIPIKNIMVGIKGEILKEEIIN